jgi:nanoRNase/pAp phosphatase (c-di-AMP/oligoRNAs hydrolase)
LMTWVENNRDQTLAARFIQDLVSRPLAEIARSPYVTEPLGPVLAQHQRNVEVVRRVARLDQGVVYSDLSDEDVGTMNKFIVYYHYPAARYAVVVLASGKRIKISVGSNPWSSVPRTHDIAAICERYGGGGHPVVGAISVPAGEIERARTIAREITTELQN